MSSVVPPPGAVCRGHPSLEAVVACRRCGTFLCRGCAKKLPRGHACAECWPVEVDASGAFVAQRLLTRVALPPRTSMYVLAAFAGLVLVLLFAAAFTHLFPAPGS